MNFDELRNDVLRWVTNHATELSDWHQTIFDFGETAWREYRSAEWYVKTLEAEGFTVEVRSGGMPTAFCATWSSGDGPTIGGYAEYDAVPGNCQAADVIQRPRNGLSKHAGGHTDPHSALGIASLGGFLAAKSVMESCSLSGTLVFFGEPAEKVRGSKPIHAAAGYYNRLDAAISFHPFYMMPLTNTTVWDTHCGAAYAVIYTFECDDPETWSHDMPASPIAASHAAARAPGANDALVQMYVLSKLLREHMVAAGCGWSMNECILTAGQATADNLPAGIAQIQYIMRVPDVAMAERITSILDANADSAARVSHCTWKKSWVSKSRPGLPNHILARACYENLAFVGAPKFNQGAALRVGRDLQSALGLTPMELPFWNVTEQLIDPEGAEHELRLQLPAWQKNFTSDDYTEYCWHTPTVRLYVARPTLAPAGNGYRYPNWVMNALGGIRETIDPMIYCAAKTIGCTVLDLVAHPALLAAAVEEFKTRTGGGIGGKTWLAPLCDYPPPINFRWPEYVSTVRGEEWCIPS